MHELNQFHATNFYRARSITFQHHLVTREMRPNTSRQLRRYYCVGTYFMYCRYILRYLHKRGWILKLQLLSKKNYFALYGAGWGRKSDRVKWYWWHSSKPLAAFCLQYSFRKKGVTLGHISNSSKNVLVPFWHFTTLLKRFQWKNYIITLKCIPL